MSVRGLTDDGNIQLPVEIQCSTRTPLHESSPGSNPLVCKYGVLLDIHKSVIEFIFRDCVIPVVTMVYGPFLLEGS